MSNVSGRGWPTKRLPDQFGAPSNAAVGGWSDWSRPRDSAAATSAMDILSDAVWRIDALDHQRSGAPSKLVRNLGTGGSVLNCRTGSTSVPDTNDPLFLPVESSAYVYLPGVASNWISTPRTASTTITGDIEVRWYGALDSWSGSADFVNNFSGFTNGYRFYINSGSLAFQWSESSGVGRTAQSTTTTGVPDGTPKWMRGTIQMNNGAGQYAVKFYTSNDGSSWTQLGLTITGSTGPSAILLGTTNIGIGSNAFGSGGNLTGKVYRAQIISNPFGTPSTVLDVDTSVLTSGSATSFQAATGQTVTINRSTSGRKAVVVPSADVKKVDDANVYLPGVAGNQMVIRNEAALQITGDIDVRLDLALDTWTPSVPFYLAGKNNTTWYLTLSTDYKPTFFWVDSGGTLRNLKSNTAVTFTAGTRSWLRAQLDVDNGAGQCDVYFYTSTDGSTWTQLGTTVTGNFGTSSIKSTTDSVVFNGYASDGSGSATAAGRYYRFQIVNPATSTTVLDIDTSLAPTSFTPGTSAAFTAVTGQTVTLNSTAGSAMRVNAERWASGSPVWLFGTDDYMEVPLSATGSNLLDFGPNNSFTVILVFRMPSFTAGSGIISNRITVGATNQGFSVSNGSGTPATTTTSTSDGIVQSSNVNTTKTQYVTSISSHIVNMQSRGISAAINGVSATSVPPTSGYLYSRFPMTIGSFASGGGGYTDMELMAAAIWRRPLTAAEIATITTYYNGRVA